MLGFKSEEGGQQGDPAFPLCYAAATHAAAVEIDEDLKPHGGGARFFFDDGYIYGPKAAVFAEASGGRARRRLVRRERNQTMEQSKGRGGGRTAQCFE